MGGEKRKRVVVIGEDDETVHADLLVRDIMMPGLAGLEVYG